MSGLSSNAVEELARAFVPLAVLGASLAGSLHCVSMCGGLLVAVAPTRRAVLFYHLGRLLGYGALGALAGLLGEKLLGRAVSGVVPWLAAVALGGSFIWLGFRVWREKPLHLGMPRFFGNRLSRFFQGNPTPWATGLLSVFLPCGWLHSFVLGAVATRSAWAGAAFLALFWLGSIPALTATPFLVRAFLRPIALRAPKVSAVLMIVAGLVTLGYKLTPLLQAQASPGGSENMPAMTCPHHPSSH